MKSSCVPLIERQMERLVLRAIGGRRYFDCGVSLGSDAVAVIWTRPGCNRSSGRSSGGGVVIRQVPRPPSATNSQLEQVSQRQRASHRQESRWTFRCQVFACASRSQLAAYSHHSALPKFRAFRRNVTVLLQQHSTPLAAPSRLFYVQLQ